MKTKIKCVAPIRYHEDIKVGDLGYIDGHVRGGDDVPYVVCIFGKNIVYAAFHNLEVIEVEI